MANRNGIKRSASGSYAHKLGNTANHLKIKLLCASMENVCKLNIVHHRKTNAEECKIARNDFTIKITIDISGQVINY